MTQTPEIESLKDAIRNKAIAGKPSSPLAKEARREMLGNLLSDGFSTLIFSFFKIKSGEQQLKLIGLAKRAAAYYQGEFEEEMRKSTTSEDKQALQLKHQKRLEELEKQYPGIPMEIIMELAQFENTLYDILRRKDGEEKDPKEILIQVDKIMREIGELLLEGKIDPKKELEAERKIKEILKGRIKKDNTQQPKTDERRGIVVGGDLTNQTIILGKGNVVETPTNTTTGTSIPKQPKEEDEKPFGIGKGRIDTGAGSIFIGGSSSNNVIITGNSNRVGGRNIPEKPSKTDTTGTTGERVTLNYMVGQIVRNLTINDIKMTGEWKLIGTTSDGKYIYEKIK